MTKYYSAIRVRRKSFFRNNLVWSRSYSSVCSSRRISTVPIHLIVWSWKMDVRVTIPCIYSGDSTGHDRNCPQNSAIAEDLLVSEHNRYRYIFCVPFFGSPFRGDKPFAAIAKPHLCNSSSRTRQSRCFFSLHAEKKSFLHAWNITSQPSRPLELKLLSFNRLNLLCWWCQ